MSDLPHGWAEARLDAIASVNPPPRKNLGDDEIVSFVPMASVEAETGRLDPSQHRVVSAVRGKSYRSFTEGDVLFAKVTPCMENGKIALATGLANGRGFGSSEFHIVRAGRGVSAKFILYFLLQRRFRADAKREMSGTAGLLRVSTRFLESSVIPIPPLAEQVRIVAAIEEQFSRLDAGVAALDSAVRKLDSFRLSALQTMRGGSWDRGPFGALVDNFDGRRVPVKASKRQKGPFPYYGAQGLIDYVDGFLFDGDYVLVAEDGENLSTRKLPIALQVHGQFWVNNHAHVVRPKPGILADYLTAVLNADPLAGAITGTAQPKLTQKALNRLLIPTPSLEEQRMLVAYMDRAATTHDNSRQALIVAAHRIKALRSSILATAFSGTLVLQDPSDEPASVILERIAAERASSGANCPDRARKSRTTREKVLA